MGGEAGGTGGIEKGVPPIISPEADKNNQSVESLRMQEKERRAFERRVVILTDKLWKKDGCPETEGLHSDYRKRAEEIIKKRIEAAARRRKKAADEPKDGEEGGGKEAGQKTQSLSIRERERLAREKFLGKIGQGITDTLNGTVVDPTLRGLISGSEKIKDNITPPADKKQQEQGKTEKQEDGRKGEESQEISNEMRLKKLIKRTEEKYGISWDDMPLDLRLETERDILSNMKPKVTTPTAAVNNFGTETPDNPPVNMAEQESDLESIKRSILRELEQEKQKKSKH